MSVAKITVFEVANLHTGVSDDGVTANKGNVFSVKVEDTILTKPSDHLSVLVENWFHL